MLFRWVRYDGLGIRCSSEVPLTETILKPLDGVHHVSADLHDVDVICQIQIVERDVGDNIPGSTNNIDGMIILKVAILLAFGLGFLAFSCRWPDETERKHGEMIAAQVAPKQVRQRDHLVSTENEMFKAAVTKSGQYIGAR